MACGRYFLEQTQHIATLGIYAPTSMNLNTIQNLKSVKTLGGIDVFEYLKILLRSS